MDTPLTRLIQRLDLWTGRLILALALVGSAGIALLIGLIVVSVIWRYGLNNPIFGINDLSTMVLILVAGSAVAYGARNQSHVSVDIISKRMGRAATRVADTVMRLASLGIIALACFALFYKACGFEKACIFNDLSVEHRVFYYFLGLCLGLYALQLVVDLLKGWVGVAPADPSGDAP